MRCCEPLRGHTCTVPLRVLLDTNIWAYVERDDAAADLRAIARYANLEILVSPAVVFEQLRFENRDLRKRQLDITTRGWWKRLMPEAYVECDELVAALRRHRPGWIQPTSSSSSLRTYHRNRADWQDRFWTRARRAPDAQAGYNDDLGGFRIDLGRLDVDRKRTFSRENKVTLDTVSLTDLTQIDCDVDVGTGKRVRTQFWRVGAANHFAFELREGRAIRRTYRDWLDPFLDYDRLSDGEAWLSFWMEVEPSEVPTQWLYWAAGVLAPLVRVNDGTLFDMQLAAYLSVADVLVTADKNFDRIACAVANAAPFPVARALRTTPTCWAADLASLA